MHDSGARAEWITVRTYTNGLEADIARDLLESEGIPVLVQSNNAGIFGLSYQGNVAGGITLQVPSPEEDRARALIGDTESVDGDVDGEADEDAQADGAAAE